MATLSQTEVASRLEGSLWRRDGETIVRDVKLDNFAEAMKLVNAVADVAEELDHHPDILIHGWNNVRFTLSTHSAGGLTDNDFTLAGRIDAIVSA